MSLVPLILDEMLHDLNRPADLFDQNFGLGMIADDLIHPRSSLVGPLRVGYYRPWRHHATRHSGISNIYNDKDGFKVNLDVQQFRPEEISVKTVNDFIVVEGKHQERQDEHGFISRQFQRRYKLPQGCEPETVQSSLSSDGVLTIAAPKKALPPPAGKERTVPITQTGAPAIKEKQGGSQEKMEQ